MNKRNSFLVLLMFVSVLGYGGRPLRYIGFAMNNYVAAKPVIGFPKMFYSQFHPGVTGSTGFNWKERVNYSWMQSFKASFFSHRFIQHSFSIYSEFGYRRKAGKWGYSAVCRSFSFSFFCIFLHFCLVLSLLLPIFVVFFGCRGSLCGGFPVRFVMVSASWSASVVCAASAFVLAACF